MGDLSNNFFSSDDINWKSAVKWKEKEWCRYIKESDAEVAKCYNMLIKFKSAVNHIDLIVFKSFFEKTFNVLSQEDFKTEADEHFFYGVEGFSIHKSPVYILSKSIVFFLEKVCDVFVASAQNIDVNAFWKFNKTLSAIKEDLFCGIYLIDVGELWPAICHFKKVLEGVNTALCVLNCMDWEFENGSKIREDLFIGLLDVRELAWQSMTFSRKEIQEEDEENL